MFRQNSTFISKSLLITMVFCLDCGTKNKDTEYSCISCGTSLDVAPAKVMGSSVDKNRINCAKCSFENKPGTNYCGGCGTNLKSPVTNTEDVLFCVNCGAKNKKGVRFCGNCGKPPLIQQQPVQPPTQYQSAPVRQPRPISQYPESGYMPQNPNYQTPSRPMPHGMGRPRRRPYGSSEGTKDITMAVVISLFIPGFGSMYTNQVGRGIGIFLGTFFSLIIPPIAFFVYIWQLFDAKKQVERYNNYEI